MTISISDPRPAYPSPLPDGQPTPHLTAPRIPVPRTPVPRIPVPRAPSDGTTPERRAVQSPLSASVLRTVDRSDKWTEWQSLDQRLGLFASLDDARQAWTRRDPRCYRVVAALTALGSRRGGDDDDAALAVLVMLDEGISRVAVTLDDVCQLDDVHAAVWGEVKAAEPQLNNRAARYLLVRARQRLTRPAAGMVPRLTVTSLDQRLGWGSPLNAPADHDIELLAPHEADDPAQDLADLLAWAQGVGVIADEDADLLVELIAAENDGLAREEAQRVVGNRHGVGMRTIRRRRDRVAAQLRASAPRYLASIA
jgi:hypothetical protein